MNLRITLVSILALFPLLIWGQWTPLSTNGLTGNLWDISSSGSIQVAIVGSDGMFYSINGGLDWTQPSFVSQPNDANIYAQTRFKKIEQQITRIVAVGHDTINDRGVVFAGAGSDWQLVYTASVGQELNDLYLDNNTAWLVGSAGFVLSLNLNSGNNFTQASGTTRDLYTIIEENIGGDSVLLRRGGSGEPDWVLVDNSATVSELVQANNLVFGLRDSSEVAYYGGGAGFFSFGRYKYPQYFPPQAVKPTCLSQSYSNNISFGTENGIFWGGTGSYQLSPSSAGYHIVAMTGTFYAITTSGDVLKTTNWGQPYIPYVNFIAPSGACRDSLVMFDNQGLFTTNYTWLENGGPLQGNNSVSPTKTYNTTGTYQITLIGSNGTLADTLSRSLTIVDPPAVNLPYTVQGALFCKTGVGSVTIQNSVPGVLYRLYSLTDQSYKGTGLGNNGAVVLSTDLMTDSTYFLISASRAFTGCEKFFTDTVFFDVETPEARFHTDLINATVGEELRLYNLSKEGDSFQWDLGSNASIVSANTLNPPAISYNQTGHQTAQLIAITSNGCADTLIDTTLLVYDKNQLAEECWAFNLRGADENYYTNKSTDFLVDAQADQEGNMIVAAHYGNLSMTSREGDEGPVLDGFGSVITKYDRFGVQKWRVVLEDSAYVPYTPFPNVGRLPSIEAISRSPSGDIYMSAIIEGNALLGSNNGEFIRFRFPPDQLGNPDKKRRTILVKYDSTGVVQWHSIQNEMLINKMVTDSMGNLYLSIQEVFYQPSLLGKTVNYISPLGDSTAMANRLDANNNLEYADAAIIKITPNGDFIWQKGFFDNEPNKIDVLINDMSVDRNNALNWIGLYRSDFNIIDQNGSVTAGPTMLSNYSGPNSSDVFLGQFDLAGTLNWTTPIVCNSNFNFYIENQVKNDINGNLYLKINSFSPPVCYSTDGSISGPNYHRGNIISYDKDGLLRWQAGTFTSSMFLSYINIGYDQKLYLSADADPFSFSPVISLSSRDSADYHQFDARFRSILLAAYDSLGNLEYFTGINGSNYEKNPKASYSPIIAGADTSGKLFMALDVLKQSSNDPFVIQNDSIYADAIDVVLISNQPNDCGPIYIYTNRQSSDFCPGDTVGIPFRVAPPFLNDTSATFYLVLYDSLGNYPETVIGSLDNPNNVDTIYGVLPNDLFIYLDFEFRIRGSDASYSYNNYTTATFVWDPLPNRPPTDTVVCQGQTIVLQTFNSAFQYQWSPPNLVNDPSAKTIFHTADSSVQLIASGLYECGWSQDTFNIEIASLAATIMGDTLLCQGDSIILTANVGSQYQYQWLDSAFLSQTDIVNPWAFPDSSRTFTVIVSDNTPGCGDTDTATFSVQVLYPPATPVISFDSTNTLLQATSAGATSFQWFLDGQAINGANAATFMPTSSGIYQVLVANSNCEGDTSAAFSYTATSLEGQFNPWRFAVSPIPSSGSLFFSGTLRGTLSLSIKMLDAQGRKVYHETLRPQSGEFRHALNLTLPAGVYLFGVEAEGHTWYQKVIITP